MESAAPSAKKRSAAEALDTGKSSTPAKERSSPEATIAKKTGSPSSQEPPPPSPPGAGEEEPNGGGGGGGVDHISGLPDAMLGDIITLLPTKDGARTQALAHRWRHLWRAAPLNLDTRHLRRRAGLPDDEEDEALAGVVTRILSAHHGPGRVFRVPAHHLHDRAAAVDAWLHSPALDSLQEIEVCHLRRPPLDHPPPPPPSLFRFSATLAVATICQCQISDEQRIPFLPQLRQLALVRVRVSEGSLHAMISSSICPALECLFLDSCHGFRCVRINDSASLRSIGVRTDYFGEDLRRFRKLVVEDAPRLEKLLCTHRDKGFHLEVSVMAAPKLETLGSLSNWGFNRSINVFGSTVFQGSLSKSGEKNLWRRKHRHLIKCFDIHLKTLVLEKYEGIMSHVRFASFFLLNAKELEVVRLEVEEKRCNEKFFAEQRLKLEVEGWTFRGAPRVDFALNRCKCRIIHVNHVRDLAIADPFECTC
ncbi:hypothetical protein HU200_018134 [Digitaria exilis]|uniref:FBD domain-containing protein n=1 Tax=Digitaria exilis TaxID=1010633 RepID=A0A835F5F1_9POAL|nr:hypothetical protein HU200_018134 [Digitaria exilis]